MIDEPMTGALLLTDNPQDKPGVDGGLDGGVWVDACHVTATVAGALVPDAAVAVIEYV